MAKKPVKRNRTANRARVAKARTQSTQKPASAGAQPDSRQQEAKQSQSGFDNLKQNLSGKRRAIFEILDDVKRVKPDEWQDPNQVEKMAKNFADKLGLPVPDQRIKQFVNAYKDATKHGPNSSVDEIVNKYGQNVDDKTLKEIKKYVPKSK
ncbi:hypothetical protein [Alicyclobacillus sp. SO9]|uniref:hypothetical protein n=1 Tax=Alicyclobacillus sp. SO9 TaxID=2665646 RepID=UPI001E44BA91|nr:hypothetical protein [Alicyclobacillus sp. SO9]